MRITRVSASAAAVPSLKPAGRSLESLLLILVALLLGYGFRQVYLSRSRALDAAERDLANGRMLLLVRLTPATEIARRLESYDDPKQRRFIADRIVDLLRRGQPANVGALARIHITRADVNRAHVAELYNERFERTGSATVRLFTYEEFAGRIKPSFAVRSPEDLRSQLLKWVLIFYAGFLLAHVSWIVIGFRGDQLVLPSACLLAGVGMILMISLRDPVRDLPVFAEFAWGVLAGCVVLTSATCLSRLLELRGQGLLGGQSRSARLLDRAAEGIRFIENRGEIPFGLSLTLSAALLIFGTGPGESGVKVRLFFFQPVEVIRFLLVLFLASYFARRWEFLRELKEKRVRLRINLPRLDYALPVMVAVILSIAFFFLQRDIGPALVLAGLFLALYAVARARIGLVLAAAGVLTGVGWLAYRIGYPPVVVTRVGMWLAPWGNGLSHGDQLVHSLWAMATGAFAGTGVGRGLPEIIPAGHTDLILSVLAEECGFLGLLLVVGTYGVLFWRSLRIACRAATSYGVFLCLGLTLALAIQGALIAGGITGILPLSGVVTPFLSYGSSALILDFLALGILLATSAGAAPKASNAAFRKPVMLHSWALATFAVLLLVKAGSVQLVKADEIVAAGTLVKQEDGSFAMAYNPRLLAVARQIPRGSIYDRTGLPVATSNWEELEKHRDEYAAVGIDIAKACSREERRHYPFGSATFHLVGDVRTRSRWTASNASFEERVSRTLLQGFDDRETLETVEVPRTGQKVRVYRYDYAQLVPLMRAQMDPADDDVRKLVDAPRNIRLTVDARFQLRITRMFQEHMRSHGWKRGAVVVLNPASGDLLAAVSLPLPRDERETGVQDSPATPIDLALFGEYPPGSSFKLVTAIAALRRDPALAARQYTCVRLPDGRVGNTVRGRLIRDDIQDKVPHGTLDMRQALIHSCNAYFAQLGAHDIGAQALQSAALLFNIETARPNTVKRLNDYLPQASFGQGEVLVTPYRMARVAAALANHGQLVRARFRLAPSEPDSEGSAAVLPPDLAGELEKTMRAVVVSGTGREAASAAIAIAGKTGTAELTGAPAHAWFVGFAPYNAAPAQRVAFAIVIESARYGGRAAAPFAIRIADAARDLRSVEEESSEHVEETGEPAAARPTGAARDPKRNPGRD
ncbi:MAG TPA: FtsW/RodA/SpoVE family cell cycle protein [Acidobacteriota bacterium]|nr:FtsW/RodA/SpoVE family cell cycle protein [Acidobacteriota bacterium]